MAAGFFTGSEVSDEDIEQLSRLIPGFRFERSPRGELIFTPNGFWSDVRSNSLSAQLWAWNDESGGGVALGSTAGFKLPDGALYSPDAAWVERSRVFAFTRQEREKFLPLCPDVVFEVLSPSDRFALVRERVLEFMKHGARLGVSLDPFNGLVEICRFDRDPETLERPERILLEARYFPGSTSDFVLELRDFFEVEGDDGS